MKAPIARSRSDRKDAPSADRRSRSWWVVLNASITSAAAEATRGGDVIEWVLFVPRSSMQRVARRFFLSTKFPKDRRVRWSRRVRGRHRILIHVAPRRISVSSKSRTLRVDLDQATLDGVDLGARIAHQAEQSKAISVDPLNRFR
jgi:hypothetical protein